jgi:hypothetical protein
MKLTYSRRYRRSSSRSRETAQQKKEGPQEQVFFAAPSERSFFKPNLSIQRKCAHCEVEEKNIKRAAFDKEDEKKIQREPEKKEEEKVQKMDDRSGTVELHRAAENKEEEKVQKMSDKKEEQRRFSGRLKRRKRRKFKRWKTKKKK